MECLDVSLPLLPAFVVFVPIANLGFVGVLAPSGQLLRREVHTSNKFKIL